MKLMRWLFSSDFFRLWAAMFGGIIHVPFARSVQSKSVSKKTLTKAIRGKVNDLPELDDGGQPSIGPAV